MSSRENKSIASFQSQTSTTLLHKVSTQTCLCHQNNNEKNSSLSSYNIHFPTTPPRSRLLVLILIF